MRKRQIPPRDSWVRLEPGKAVVMDARLTKVWKEKEREWREVRGNIVAACFEIEYLLDHVLCEVFFPGLDKAPSHKSVNEHVIESYEDVKALRDLFDDVFFKSALIPFVRKIELFNGLVSRIRVLQELVPQGLVDKLHKIRDIRNRFAHYPVTFTPIGDMPTQQLRVSLVCRDKELELNDRFFDEYNPLFSTALSQLEEVVKGLKENPSRRWKVPHSDRSSVPC